ncbi:MAG: hypothetical protein AABW46_04605 [Nanoarchaeota archaeon]
MLSDKVMLEKARKAIKERPELFEAMLEFERTGKLPKLTYKKRANFTIDEDILRKFRNYCKDKGYNMSAKIEQMMLDLVKRSS